MVKKAKKLMALEDKILFTETGAQIMGADNLRKDHTVKMLHELSFGSLELVNLRV